MSQKNRKTSRHASPLVPADAEVAPPLRAEWRVLAAGDEHDVPCSSLHRGTTDGSYVFRDEELEVVAEFQASTVTGVLRRPAREPAHLTLPASFSAAAPYAIRELQEALDKVVPGFKVVVHPAGSQVVSAKPDSETGRAKAAAK